MKIQDTLDPRDLPIPSGYKRTKVGVVPSGWEVDEIGNHTSIKTGAKNTQDREGDGEYPFFVRSQTVERINSYSFDGEAVLTAGDGVGTGKVFHYINGRFDVHQRVYRITDFDEELDGRYFFYQFSTRFHDRIMSMTAKSSVDSVRMDMIAKMPIPLPKLLEQRAIAAALSDVDALIGALDAAVAKKRAIKLAAMQQLLTGKTRLPGFDSEWRMVTLGELADIQRGASPRPIDSPIWYDAQSKIGWVRISDIANSDRRTLLRTRDYLSSKGVAASRFIPAGTLIMSICATVGRPVITGFDTCIHDGFVSFSNLRHVDQNFLFYKLKELEPEFSSMGQTGSQANLNTDLVKGCEIRLPYLDEQAAIAAVLSDMDAEITGLEQRREKTRAIKQGMMQALLTGRVRLVES